MRKPAVLAGRTPKLGIQATSELVSSLFLAALVILKGNGNASKRVCVQQLTPDEVHKIKHEIFINLPRFLRHHSSR
jgi:hypothetical protein